MELSLLSSAILVIPITPNGASARAICCRPIAVVRRIVPLLVLFLLVVSSLPLLALGESHNPNSLGNGADQSTPASSPTNALNSARLVSRDWKSFANDQGEVQVIVVVDGAGAHEKAIDDVIGKVVSHKSESGQSKAMVSQYDSLISELNHGSKRHFSNALKGFSVKLSVDSAELLGQIDASITVYPDQPVHAYMGASIRQVGADQMWVRTDSNGLPVTGNGIIVAVIDTGVDYTHPGLGGGFGPSFKVIGGYDFFNDDPDPRDDNGHGTHVSGIIAANGAGFKGVAPDAKILAYKVLGADGYGMETDILTAIDAAVDPNGDGDNSDHADIISLSLGGMGGEDDPMVLAVEAAIDAGVVVVVAAGNDGPSLGSVGSPGCAPEAITVGAIDASGTLASFSSRGTGSSLRIKPEVCAPGVMVDSTVPYSNAVHSSPTGHATMSGTSMATPHVSGSAALLLQMHPDWNPSQVKSAIVSGVSASATPVWYAGAGNLYVPSAADAEVFLSEPLVSYGLATGSARAISLTNLGPSASFQVTSKDWYSLSAAGTISPISWINVSSALPSSINIASGGTVLVELSIPHPSITVSQGYYEGEIHVVGAGHDVRFTFGYVVLSRLNVHVVDMQGREVFDPYGWVAVYDVPDVNVCAKVWAGVRPSPPAGFLLPAGNYSVHAAGHQSIYLYRDPYLLSAEVSLGRLESREIYLNMSSARQLKLDLKTNESIPIYVKDYRIYCSYSGKNNFSMDIHGADYSTESADITYLPTSKIVYVSDTDAAVGISVVGYSYSASMWDFIIRNSDHLYQFTQNTGNNFLIESTADLQYFLAWEFNSISSSTPQLLTLVPGTYSVYDTKYDIPGALGAKTGNWGSTVSSGGLATLYIRRDTDTPINPFFSGMTRKTIVQGVFSEIYLPGDLYDESFEREFYSADYSHSLIADPVNGIYMPQREYLSPLPAVTAIERIGAAPVYPSIHTENSNATLVIYGPILKDQDGARIVEGIFPGMAIYRDGNLLSSGYVLEFMARPDAFRVVPLSSSGFYTAEFTASATPQMCDRVKIVLGFRVPGLDIDPPQITGLKMSQRFVPGEAVGIRVSATDDTALNNVEISWRQSDVSSWQNLPVSNLGGGDYGASIQTGVADSSIHLKVRVTDQTGNFLEYSASNASRKQVPVLFSLMSDLQDVEYKDSDAMATITGFLTDVGGAPLSPGYSVPIELVINGKKVAMILDDHVTSGSRVHDGTIRFDWHFNPKVVFSRPDEHIDIQASFDLGVYEPKVATISLYSIAPVNGIPSITLQSPANGSLFAAGTLIDLDITDDGSFTASASVDGIHILPFASPWQISTSSWGDGHHVLEVVATDDQLAFARASFVFETDALAPSIAITYPSDGARIPMNSVLTADVSDARLSTVTCSVDGNSPVPMTAPYRLDMTGWIAGQHSVTITARDLVGHSTTKRVTFEISTSSIVLQLLSPADRSVIRSGIAIRFTSSGNGSMTYKWCEGGTWTGLGTLMTVSTVGWLQGFHTLLINATSSLGGWDQITVAVTIDDVVPVIQLQSPSPNSFVSTSDRLVMNVQEGNLDFVTWTLWGRTSSSSTAPISISLASCPADGSFTLFVTAMDKAGNVAKAEFSFAMDSKPPSLSVGDLASGDAVRPGFVMNVSASDAYLSLVQWTLDNGQSQVLATPYKIDTLHMALGWHTLQLVAKDASGKQTALNVSLYLDDAAPIIGGLSPSNYTVGSDLVVTVRITDDFKVGGATLYYELRDGEYANVRMNPDNGSFVAVLPASVLWDGMKVYVLGVDAAGNIAESSRTELRAAIAPSGSGGMAPPWNHLGSVGGIVFISAVALISSISFFFVAQRRNKDDEETAEPKGGRASPQRTASMASTAPTLPATRTMREGRPKSSFGSSMSVAQVNTSAERSKSSIPASEAKKVLKMPSLLECIPEVLVKSQVSGKDSDLETDYGAMIERELITPSLKTSIFRDSYVELDKQLAELVSLFEEPRKKSGLALKFEH